MIVDQMKKKTGKLCPLASILFPKQNAVCLFEWLLLLIIHNFGGG